MKITQDLHMHTHLSRCAKPEATLEAYIAQATSLGLDTLGIADHLWDAAVGLPESYSRCHNFYEKQNVPHVLSLREEAKGIDTKGLRILFGAEAEYDPVKNNIALTEEAAQALDFIIVPNSHTHMIMQPSLYEPHQAHADYMLKAMRDILRSPISKYVTAVAHPFDAVCCPYDNHLLYPLISKSEYADVFTEAKEKGIAIELNTSSCKGKTNEEIKADSKWEIFHIAKECGCKFTFGSDCHHPDSQKSILGAKAICELLSLTDEDLLVL